MTSDQLARNIAPKTVRLTESDDFDTLLERIGDAHYVLLGEASHGTSEYYTWRARLSQRLIAEKGFSFVAVEGDWPACYEVNRMVKGYDDRSPRETLQAFHRWPTWMWANWEVVAFTTWLKQFNDGLDDNAKVGFYGLDVYSLWDSLAEILDYLREHDPDALETAKQAYRCFEPYDENVHDYARATMLVPESCEDEVVSLLSELRGKIDAYPEDHESRFSAAQNAEVAVNAERYYRAMVQGGPESWNVRDIHMADTLGRLVQHHADLNGEAKAIVWEHNTHIGDARATSMARAGMVNLGQLVRERNGRDDTVLVGFGGYQGSVIAGDAWGEPLRAMKVPKAQADSWEDVFYKIDADDRIVITRDIADLEGVHEPRGHRAIGVVYNPALERFGNYVPTTLSERYDAFIAIANTQALHPLREVEADDAPPETYPWGV
ncbi:MAG: erythromycin esterase family protein [Trueperaceae bacterium]|nr:erythromycin esterase family protein [Trueperaceae bacterium]